MAVPLIPIIAGLAEVFPAITWWLGGDKAEQTVAQVAGVAKNVTGLGDPVQAAEAIKADPDLAYKFKMAMLDFQLEKARIDLKDRAEFKRRTEALEGTAADLKSMPVLGRLMLFLRGAQRPVWGFAALWMVYHQPFSGAWTLSGRQESILMAITVLVLGFLFGERAVKNVAPIMGQFFGKVDLKTSRTGRRYKQASGPWCRGLAGIYSGSKSDSRTFASIPKVSQYI